MSYIYLDRQIMDHWTYKDKPFNKSMAWIDLILLADHTTHSKKMKGKMITFKRGDVNRSISYLAQRWGWSRDKTSRFLSLLEQDDMVRINATTHRTIITLVKYEDYQVKVATNRATSKATKRATDKATNCATNRTHLSNNISNNSSNIEKEIKEKEAAPPDGGGPDGKGEIPEGWTEKDESEFQMMYEDNNWKTRKAWAEYWKDGEE